MKKPMLSVIAVSRMLLPMHGIAADALEDQRAQHSDRGRDEHVQDHRDAITPASGADP